MGFPTPSTASPNGLLTYPLDTIDATAAPNCNSLIESPSDTPATENRPSKSYDIENKIKNNNNDRPDDDNNDDVDCFPRQDKQPVISQQDIPTTETLPSLIESPTDTPAT